MYRQILTALKNSRLLSSVFALSFILSVFLPSVSFCDQEKIKIGVLAYRGKDEALKRWGPTAEYLTSRLPGYSFTAVPLDFDEIGPAVGRGDVDYVIANPAIYVELEAKYGVTRMATLKTLNRKEDTTTLGGVIFCRSDRADIKDLGGLKGKNFMAVDKTSLGGWMVAYREFKANDIDPYNDFKSLQFAKTHDAVVYAVRDGKADAGTIRTDILERMAEDGKIDIGAFRVLNLQEAWDFPYLLSTRLYPEWPFAMVKDTSLRHAEQVAIALLDMPKNSAAAEAAKIAGWTIPLSYQPVHDLLRELRLGPYSDYGKITLSDVFRLYLHWVIAGLALLLLLAATTLYVLRLNRRLTVSRSRLEEARNGLELAVLEKTRELSKANEELSQDIIKQKQAEKQILQAKMQIEASHAFLQTVVDSIDESIMVIDTDYRIEMMNKTARKFSLGVDRIPDASCCYQVSHHRDTPCEGADDPCPVQMVLAEKRSIVVTHKHFNSGGQKSFVEIMASPVFNEKGEVIKIIETSRDITEKIKFEKAKKLLEERLLQEQKEQSIAALAGGIAHEFNNALMAVLGYAELLMIKLPHQSQEHGFAANISMASNRMADLTKQLLAYAKGGKYQPKAILLHDAIKEALDLTHKGKAKEIEIIQSLADDLCPVYADLSQIIQVFINLFNNAFEAMEDTGGRLIIHSFNSPMRPPWICPTLHYEHVAGDYVSVRVSDTGKGIPEELIKTVFEPFVTTKFFGRGLGLAAVQGILHNHGGCVTVENKAGKGAAFQLFLPCLKAPLQEADPV